MILLTPSEEFDFIQCIWPNTGIDSAPSASDYSALFLRELAHEFLTKPIKVTVGSDDLAAGTRIKQIVEVIDDRARESKLMKLLKVGTYFPSSKA